MKEHARRQEIASKPGDMPVLDLGTGSEQFEPRRQTRQEAKRQCGQRQQLAQMEYQRQPLLNELKSGLLTPFDHCAYM